MYERCELSEPIGTIRMGIVGSLKTKGGNPCAGVAMIHTQVHCGCGNAIATMT